jgi:hypothetical protein
MYGAFPCNHCFELSPVIISTPKLYSVNTYRSQSDPEVDCSSMSPFALFFEYLCTLPNSVLSSEAVRFVDSNLRINTPVCKLI